ncbi:MAG: hypothetical protein RL757_662 [Bacteroidota bacterium]
MPPPQYIPPSIPPKGGSKANNNLLDKNKI